MDTVLQGWIGTSVVVTLRASMSTKVEGVLAKGDAAFLVLDQGEEKGEMLIPIASILHITPKPRMTQPET
jgi:hypothetical protein